MKHIVIVGSKKIGSKNNPHVLAASLEGKARVTVVCWEDLVFSISSHEVSVLRDDVAVFDAADQVIALGWYKNGKQSVYRDVALSLALYLQEKGVPFWNSEMIRQRSTSKLSCMMMLALAGIAVPTTRFSLKLEKALEGQPLPRIVKAVSASRGRDNYLVKTDEDAEERKRAGGYYLVQEYLPNDHDLRVLCFGGKPRLVLRRSRVSQETHLNNTSQGGAAQWIPLEGISEKVLTESYKICTIMQREMAGIDLIPDSSAPGGYACLEVNAIPQLTSGYGVDVKMSEFAQSLIDGSDA